MPRHISNMAASVRQQLLNLARASKRPFNELLQHFAMERFLYRLSTSPYADKFVLKGGLMMLVWKVPISRPTMDIDLLGYMANDVQSIVDATRDVCCQDVERDGMEFDPESVQGTRIAEHAEYDGVRVRFRGRLGTARIAMQLDVGFGDAITPGPQLIEYPTILEMPVPSMLAYTFESSIAEKLHVMVRRGIANSRMRDFFDVFVLSHLEADGGVIADAISKTFLRRDMVLPPEPVAFTTAFGEDPVKTRQWQAFVSKSQLVQAPRDFAEVVLEIAAFLGPVVRAIAAGHRFEGVWPGKGPWSNAPSP